MRSEVNLLNTDDLFSFSLSETSSVRLSTLVCLIFPWIVFPLDILFYGDERTCQRKNQVEQGEKFYLFIMVSSSFPTPENS